MLWLLVAVAHAQQLGVIEMPYTPSDDKPEYATLVAVSGATGKWTADAEGFVCTPLGDYVEVKITPDRWPSAIPKHVTCLEQGGKGKAKARIRIREGRHEPMFVTDGTLVLPRVDRAAASWQGAPQIEGLVVGRGESSLEGVRCEVVPGPKIAVTVSPDAQDGRGSCSLRLSNGHTYPVKLHVVTVGK